MLKKLLKKENVIIIDSVATWQEAVYLSTEKLLSQNYITKEYAETIIDLTNKYGAYYIIADQVALVHANPESGVLETQISLTKLNEVVYFGKKNDKPVKLLITLASKNAKDHLIALKEIADILMDNEKLEYVMNINNATELYEEFIKGRRKYEN